MLSALLTHLARDQQVRRVFAQFPAVTDAAFRVGALGDAIAHAVGFSSRRELRASAGDRSLLDLLLETNDPWLGPRFVEFIEASQALVEIKQATVDPLAKALAALVRDTWGRPQLWWLALELLWHHERLMNAAAFGTGWEGSFSLRRPSPTLPPPPAPQAGETYESYRLRLEVWDRAQRAALTPPAQPRGGIQANDERHERDAEWWYRHELRRDPQDSLRALAREEARRLNTDPKVAEAQDLRRTVKDGIARAERIFSDVPVARQT